MTTETLMTEQAATTTEGQTASQGAASTTTQGEQTQTQAGEQTTQTQQQATDGQTTEGQQATDGKTEGEGEGKTTEQKPEGAPEQYEFKAPEGQEFSPEVITAYSDIAKELNLPQDAAQKILDTMGPVLATRQAEAIKAVQTEWANASRSDKEFGGDKLNENLAVAQKAMNAFTTPEFRTLLNESGLGNNPEVIRTFYRVGKAISEDGIVSGSRASAPADPAKRMFPNQA